MRYSTKLPQEQSVSTEIAHITLQQRIPNLFCSFCRRPCATYDSKLQHQFDNHVWLGGVPLPSDDSITQPSQEESAFRIKKGCGKFDWFKCPHCPQMFRLPSTLR